MTPLKRSSKDSDMNTPSLKLPSKVPSRSREKMFQSLKSTFATFDEGMRGFSKNVFNFFVSIDAKPIEK
jgi:hypothetical protein